MAHAAAAALALLASGCGSVAGDGPPDAPDGPGDGPPDAPLGETLWTFSFGDSGGDAVMCARLAEDGHAILVGEARGSITVGGTEIVTPPGDRSYFVTRLDAGAARPPTILRNLASIDVSPINTGTCAADTTGRLIVPGTLTAGTAGFGAQNVTTTTPFSAFHAVFTANGALQWVRAVGDQEAYGGGAAFDRQGSAYAAHLFVGPANLGGATHIAPNYDSLFGRYNSAGELQASFHRGGLGNDEVGSIEVDSAGNLWLAGQYHDTTQYGGPTLPDPYVEREAFIVKLTAEGQHVFSRSLASRGPDYYPRVDLDERNQAWISQPFEGTLDLGGGRVLTSKDNSRDLAIIHLDAGGDVLAAWSVGGAADEHAITHDLAADGDEVVLAFTVGAAGATIGGIPVGGKGGYDIAVVRFAADGRVLSARTYGTAGEDYASSIDVGPSGTLLAGYFGAGLPSSQLSFDNATLTSGGFSDGFVAMLRPGALR